MAEVSYAPESEIEGIAPNFKRPQREFLYTSMALSEAKDMGFYEEPDKDAPKGYYMRRRIIGRDTPINKGVYNGHPDEAIVVDDTGSDGHLLNRVYEDLLNRRRMAEASRGEHFKAGVLFDVFKLVREKLPYNMKLVNSIAIKHGIKPKSKTSLGIYLAEKAGVCRHQALLGGYLLERLINENKLHGKVSVDRSYVKGIGGHAWIRYITSAGKVVIIDPAAEFAGSLSQVNPDEKWFYRRPTLFEKARSLFGI